MKLAKNIRNIISRIYAAGTMIERNRGRYAISFKTDDFGRPVLLFLGKITARGKIKAGRFARHLVTDRQGTVIKDHWDDLDKAG